MADRRPFLLGAYLRLARILTPLFHVLFWLRSRKGKEMSRRRGERFGYSALNRPNGELIWIHAASVGETMSVLPLIGSLASRGAKVLLTTVTVTAAELAAQRLPEGSIHQFVPYDAPGPLGRFLEHWSPDLVMTVESEIWPCLFDEMRRRETPFVLLNGRLSDGSHRRWGKLRTVSEYIFGCLDLVLAQSPADADRFRQLGCGKVETPGNLKFDASEPLGDAEAVSALRHDIGKRPVWLAALTHPGEEEIVLEAFQKLRLEFPALLLVIVPRHPARAAYLKSLVEGQGLSIVSRSSGSALTGDIDVYLGDTLGEMGLYYRIAPVTFLGGSFNDAGGHNPVEAALTGSALVTGPRVANARAVYKDFFGKGAVLKAATPADLSRLSGRLLRHPGEAREQAELASNLVHGSRGALEKSLQLLQPYLKGKHLDRTPETPDEQGS